MPNQSDLSTTTRDHRRIANVCCCFLLLIFIGEKSTALAQSETQKRNQLNGLLNGLADEPENARYILEEIEWLGVRSPQAVAKVIPFLSETDTETQEYAAGAYLALGGSEERIWAMTKARSGWTRLGAALALSRHAAAPADLMPLLSDKFATIRAELGVALIESGVEPKKFFHLVEDEDDEVREQVGVALVEAGVDPNIVVPLLSDKIEDVRFSVALAFTERRIAFDAIKPLLSDELPHVRSEIGVAICEAFGPVPELTPLLRDDRPAVRAAIGVALVKADCKEERVRSLLDDKAKSVREEIAFALLKRLSPNREPLLDILAERELLDEDVCLSLGPKSRAYLIPKIIIDKATGELDATDKLSHFLHLDASSTATLSPLLRSATPEVRERTFELITRCIPGSENNLASDLRKSLLGLGPGSQSFALEIVKRRDLTGMVPDVIRLMGDTVDHSIRVEAARTVARLAPRNTECIRILLDAANKSKGDFSMYGEKIATNGPRVLAHESTLRKALDDPKVRGRSWSGQRIRENSDYVAFCLALIRSGGDDSLNMIARWLQDPEITPLAIQRLLNQLEFWDGDIAAAAPAIATLLDHSEDEVRESAATTLTSKNIPLEPGKLATLLDDPNAKIVHRAAQLLEFCEPPHRAEVAAIFRRCLKGNDVVVKAFAVRWLAKQKLGEPPLDSLHEILLASDLGTGSFRTGDAYYNAVSEATTLMKAQLAAALAEVAKTDERLKPLIRKALTKDATAAQLRSLLEQLLLTAPDPQSRVQAARQLQSLKDKRSLPALTKALEDEADYSYMISNDMGGTAPIRSLVLRVIADIGPSVSLQPKLLKYLFDERTRGDAATAIGAIGPAAHKSLPILKRLYGKTNDVDLALAIAQIDTDKSEQAKFLKQVLAAYRSHSDRYYGPPIDRILATGEVAKQLIPQLKFMVEEHELLHRDHRVNAAYALAILEPENSKWRDYLVQQSKHGEYHFDQATERLRQLETREASQD